jgi:ribosomal protein S18 acetylase RimI-like enzyme
VAEDAGRLVGFQISTAVPLSGHMARLAVHPDYRHAHIGAYLTRDMLLHFSTGPAWKVTLNTQNTNHAALSLYTSLGFRLTGETFPVYQYRLSG